jgi:hypothetical protein
MLSPISDTGHLVRRSQPPLELGLLLLNVAAYTLALANILATLS